MRLEDAAVEEEALLDVRVRTMGCWRVTFLLFRWMEGEEDVTVEEERMADGMGMGELGKGREGAVGGRVEAMVESTDTAGLLSILDGDGMGVDAIL